MTLPDIESSPEDRPHGAKSLRQLALDRTKALAQTGDVSYDMVSDLPWPVQKDLWDKSSSREQQLESQIARLESFLQRTDLGPQPTKNLSYKMVSELPLQSQKCAWHMLLESEQRLEQRLQRLESDVPVIDREALLEIDPNQSFIARHPESLLQNNSTALSQQAKPSEWQRLIGQLHYSLEVHEVLHGQAKLGICFDNRIRYKSARLAKNSEDSTIRWGLCFDESCNHNEHFALTELISPSLFRRHLACLGWIVRGPFVITMPKGRVINMMIATIDGKSNQLAELCINMLLSPIGVVPDDPSRRRSTKEIETIPLESRQMAFARRYGRVVKASMKET
jgi:hypothetical protein